MSLEVGSDKGGVVSQRRVLRVTGDDAVGSSDAERFRDDAEVVDSIERDLCRLRPSAGAEEVTERAQRSWWEFAWSSRLLKMVFGRPKHRADPYFPTIIFSTITIYHVDGSSSPTHRLPHGCVDLLCS